MQVDTTTTIARPPTEVFAFVADVRNDPAWHTDVLDVSSSTEVVGKGTVFDVKVKPSMGVSEGTMTVTRFEPDTVIEYEGRMGKMAPTVTHVCEAAGEGTRVTRRVVLDPPGIMRLGAPLIRRMIAKDNAGFLANLKQVLESGGATTAR
jgi:carbon monoxide dehydrogenase subunit G